MSKPKNKDEFRQELAEQFAHVLEEKGLDWKKEWNGGGVNMPPHNGVTGNMYRGCNVFHLSLVSMLRGYNDSRWLTMTQIVDKYNRYHPDQKWHLKEGSKATYVEYWYPYDILNKKAVTWDEYYEDLHLNGVEVEKQYVFSTRYIAVFNASQVDGIPKEEIKPNSNQITPDELIGKLSRNMGVPIINDGGDNAYYQRLTDTIHLPPPLAFDSNYAYDSTALHELAHSTGHPSRLNREQPGFFGSSGYAYEELVAEMSACFMSSGLQIQPSQQHIDNHKAYIQSWIQSIREKPDTLIHAIRDAQAAANYMDFKAELITEQEYKKLHGNVLEVKKEEKERGLER